MSRTSWRPPPPPPGPGGVRLEPVTSRESKAGLLLLFAVLWNGSMALFLAIGIEEYQRAGSLDGCMVAFFALFLLPGLFALYLLPSAIQSLKSPRPVLVLEERRPEPGTETILHWSFENEPERVHEVRMSLYANETAISGHGTSRHEDVEQFYEQELVATDATPWQGSVPVAIPDPTMHTFLGKMNRVTWSIFFQTRVHGLPDVDEAFELVVHPRRIEP